MFVNYFYHSLHSILNYQHYFLYLLIPPNPAFLILASINEFFSNANLLVKITDDFSNDVPNEENIGLVCTGCGVDGVDVIRISITSEDGTTTSLDVPIGSGLF